MSAHLSTMIGIT